MRKSSCRISTFPSSSMTGATSSDANDVCRRAFASNGEMRTSLCTPRSHLR